MKISEGLEYLAKHPNSASAYDPLNESAWYAAEALKEEAGTQYGRKSRLAIKIKELE